MTDQSSSESLKAIFAERDAVILVLAAVLDDLGELSSKNQLQELIRELQAANSVEDLHSNPLIVQWLPVLASGFNRDSVNNGLTNLIVYASRNHEIQVERRRALAYPALLFLSILLVFTLLTLFVVPAFDHMFEDYGIALPGATQVVVSLSREIRTNPIRVLSTLIAGFAAILAIKKLWAYTGLSHRLFKFLINGNSASLSDISVLTSRLAELIHLGIKPNHAMTIASSALKSHWYRRACKRLAIQMDNDPLWQESKVAHQFPPNMILALQNLKNPNVALLREISEIYAERVHHRVKWATGAFAQISVVALGVVIGFIVIVLLTPLVSLISVLS